MKTWIALACLCIGPIAEAQLPNLPELAGSTPIGRTQLYKSVQPISWFQPTAFSNELTCTSNSGENRTCSIKIFNSLNEAEKKQLEQLIEKEKLSVVNFSDLDSRVVSNIREGFEGLPEDLNGQMMVNGNLRLTDGQFPYASNMFRVKRERAEELKAQYQSEGLGHFIASFTVHGQRTETYLALQDGKCLKSRLQATQGQEIGKREINKLLDEAIAACRLKFVNYDEDEAQLYMRTQLRDSFFEYSWWTGYALNADKLRDLGESYVLNSRVRQPLTLNCRSDLLLADGAMPKTICQSAEGEQQ